MKPVKEGYRVAVVGASSLLGKELVDTLEERAFPVSRLVTFESDEEEPELPIIDLRESSKSSVQDEDVADADLDFAFLVTRPRRTPAFLSSAVRPQSASAEGRGTHCVVIDLSGEGLGGGSVEETAQTSGEPAKSVVSIPFLDQQFPLDGAEAARASFYVSAHPAVIVISSLLLRLAARFPVKTAVAQLFVPASETGTRGIEELQKQTVNLLSFQKIPRQVFGAQLAFNLLARLGRAADSPLSTLEGRLRQELRQYLAGRVPLPALRLFQSPVFYSLALSLYVETAAPVLPEQAGTALQQERLRLRRLSQDAPSQVEVAGSSDILVDSISGDAEHPTGLWIWAVADNLRLAALNATEIAENIRSRVRT
jgi:aspartate-semialdehyde dehydrogenase